VGEPNEVQIFRESSQVKLQMANPRNVPQDSTSTWRVSLSREPRRVPSTPIQKNACESLAIGRGALHIASDNMGHPHAWCKRLRTRYHTFLDR
jgi:hypothetical protein